tara:strand:+ start:12897 stop:13466 length:570 start_codon:yes stop_codon:yes gene_type:complete
MIETIMQPSTSDIRSLAKEVISLCIRNNIILTTAESCTGGMISMAITDIPGSSSAFERGYITYSNRSKIECLGVQESLIQNFGSVSSEVAVAMAEGALLNSNSTLSLAVTGIAGPKGGTTEKPVGLVYIASSKAKGRTTHKEYIFIKPKDVKDLNESKNSDGSSFLVRDYIRNTTTIKGLELLLSILKS